MHAGGWKQARQKETFQIWCGKCNKKIFIEPKAILPKKKGISVFLIGLGCGVPRPELIQSDLYTNSDHLQTQAFCSPRKLLPLWSTPSGSINFGKCNAGDGGSGQCITGDYGSNQCIASDDGSGQCIAGGNGSGQCITGNSSDQCITGDGNSSDQCITGDDCFVNALLQMMVLVNTLLCGDGSDLKDFLVMTVLFDTFLVMILLVNAQLVFIVLVDAFLVMILLVLVDVMLVTISLVLQYWS